MNQTCDAIIIGAGFYGLYLSQYLARRFKRVIVCERGGAAMQRASYNNQARVHNGYHYPRSILTAVRSRHNFPRFVEEFRPAIEDGFEQIYAVARRGSKISADQFVEFMRRIEAPIQPAPKSIVGLFDRSLVEGVFRTTEYAFNASKLKELMLDRAAAAGVDLRLRTAVTAVRSIDGETVEAQLATPTGSEAIQAGHVFCCGYAQLNQPTAGMAGAAIALKHELTELALVEAPDVLRRVGVTMMDGPFFSCMPFPARDLHTLSHVRYTPHAHWYDGEGEYRAAYDVLASAPKETAFAHMVRDAARYLPALARCRYRESLWEVKTVLPRSEVDDSRPILFRPHYGGVHHYHLVMGGKIDNIYDVLDVIGQELGWSNP